MEIIKKNRLVPVSCKMQLQQQSSPVSSITSEELIYVDEIRKKYGSYDGVLKRLSFKKIGAIGREPGRAITANVPSFIRLDKTFGRGAAKRWLFEHLKSLLLHMSIDSDKMSDPQIAELADIIAARYPWLKLTEFMLFEFYFIAGQYGRFYGESSYFLTITQGLLKFLEERKLLYAVIEREAEEAKLPRREVGISWEEHCRSMGIVGKPPQPGHLCRLLNELSYATREHLQSTGQ